MPARSAAEAFNFAPAATRKHALSAASVALTISRALAGKRADQMVKLGLDRGQVGEDVGVIELEVVQDRPCAAR